MLAIILYSIGDQKLISSERKDYIVPKNTKVE